MDSFYYHKKTNFLVYRFAISQVCSIVLSNKHSANVAQSVEQLTRNEQVIGSNPIIGSNFFLLHLVAHLVPYCVAPCGHIPGYAPLFAPCKTRPALTLFRKTAGDSCFCFISWHISCLTASLPAVTYRGMLPCSLLVKHDLLVTP